MRDRFDAIEWCWMLIRAHEREHGDLPELISVPPGLLQRIKVQAAGRYELVATFEGDAWSWRIFGVLLTVAPPGTSAMLYCDRVPA